MKGLKAVILLLTLALPVQAGAQRISPADSTSAFKATQLIAPGTLIGSGLAIHFFAHDTWDVAVRNRMQSWSAGKPDPCFDDYIQYAPLILDIGLGFTGIKAEHCFIDRTIEAALAYAVSGIISGTSKWAFGTLRPNGANTLSFPSGHCVFAFTGAELVRKEYGWAWGAGAYCVATTVAFMRMYRDWHWFSDVLAGAGVGILSANIGCWLLEPTKRLFGINLPDNLKFAVVPGVDPYSGALCTSLAVRF